MEHVEIVIRPIHIERVIYAIIIIALAVLLIINWGGGSCKDEVNETGTNLTTDTNIGVNDANTSLAAIPQTEDLCANGVKDQDETDIDCGGSCDGCAAYKSCNVNNDCASDYCHLNIKCMDATCDDGIKNQDETDIDCGGECTSSKGKYWYDSSCHKEEEVILSGRVEIKISNVDVGENTESGMAKVESLKFTVENGKDEPVILKGKVYLRDYRGSPYFESSMSGDEIPVYTENIPKIMSGDSYSSSTIEIKRTLPETDSNEEYQIIVELRDDNDNLIDKATWKNS